MNAKAWPVFVPTKCSHGKPLTDGCIDCDIIWEEMCLRDALKSVQKHMNRLDDLRAKQKGVER